MSNNAESAIRAYLERWSLTPYVVDVIGRPQHWPDLMKPNIHTVDEALRLLRLEANRVVFIGDSVSTWRSPARLAYLTSATLRLLVEAPNCEKRERTP